jgi:peptide methionine sulfoxide reductase MsrA
MQLVASRPLAFDLEVISYEELVRIFFKSHGPTLDPLHR